MKVSKPTYEQTTLIREWIIPATRPEPFKGRYRRRVKAKRGDVLRLGYTGYPAAKRKSKRGSAARMFRILGVRAINQRRIEGRFRVDKLLGVINVIPYIRVTRISQQGSTDINWKVEHE